MLDEDATNEIYRFYGFASDCLILLFTSLESFINHILPDKNDYIDSLKNRTHIYNKDQIQRNIQLIEKIKKVLPFFFKKNFFHKRTEPNQLIINLKEIRDAIVHTKSQATFESQEDLIKKVIKFKYEETFRAVATFMNFYKEDYIVECDCSDDY